MCGDFAHALRMHLRPLQPIIPSLSSDDNSARESDDEEPPRLTWPPKFKISSAPPHKDCLEPLNPKGKTLVGQHILYNWHGYGWCQGIITKWNDNPSTVMGSDSAIVNFTLQWHDDDSTSKHVLSMDSYNHDTREAVNKFSGPLARLIN